MSEKIYLTEEGRQKLIEELDHLTKVEMPAISARIGAAREQGDLSENAEYTAARDEQARINGRIQEIEHQLKNAEVFKSSGNKNVVSIGSLVKVYDHYMEETAEYQLVGTAEANIEEGKISNESDVGKAILGRKVGETVTVEAPVGSYELDIIEIG